MRNKYCILILLTVLSLSWKQKNNMKSNERIVYALDVTIPGRYEAYINDILVETNNEMSMHNTIININQAVLKSGTYQFRIKLFSSNEELRKGGIQPDTFQFLKVGLVKYQKIAVGEGAEEGSSQRTSITQVRRRGRRGNISVSILLSYSKFGETCSIL